MVHNENSNIRVLRLGQQLPVLGLMWRVLDLGFMELLQGSWDLGMSRQSLKTSFK